MHATIPASPDSGGIRPLGARVGLAVDSLFGESQTVIKPLGRLLGEVPGITGSAILGSGRVALILDVPAVVREATASGSAESMRGRT